MTAAEFQVGRARSHSRLSWEAGTPRMPGERVEIVPDALPGKGSRGVNGRRGVCWALAAPALTCPDGASIGPAVRFAGRSTLEGVTGSGGLVKAKRLPRGARVLGGTARLAEAGVRAGPRRARRDGQRWRCHSCGEVLATWNACEDHTSSHGIGARFDCLIGEAADSAALTPIRPGLTPTSRSCAYCGAGLDGKRADAQYCSASHRVLACRKRKMA
jgi:hypothetical protein